jgi:hypothetical protein
VVRLFVQNVADVQQSSGDAASINSDGTSACGSSNSAVNARRLNKKAGSPLSSQELA